MVKFSKSPKTSKSYFPQWGEGEGSGTCNGKIFSISQNIQIFTFPGRGGGLVQSLVQARTLTKFFIHNSPCPIGWGKKSCSLAGICTDDTCFICSIPQDCTGLTDP